LICVFLNFNLRLKKIKNIIVPKALDYRRGFFIFVYNCFTRMKKILLSSFLFILLISGAESTAQNLDSLWTVYKNAKNPDSIRFEAFNDIAWGLLYSNPDSTYLLGQEELERARSKKLKKWESKALNTIGASFQIKGVYLKAIDYYQQSLTIREQMGDKHEIAVSNANIGSIYISIGEFKKALSYQLKSLKIFNEIGNNNGKASTLNNIGIIYNNLADYYQALAYSMNSLKTYELIGDKQGVATANGNIGNIYSSMGDAEKALEYQLKSLKIAEEIGDVVSASTIRSTIGRSYMQQKQYALALNYLTKAKEIAIKNEDINSEREAIEVLYETYKKMNDPGKALINYELFITLRDSILKENNQKELTRKELQFEYDKKTAADSVKHAGDQKIKDALIVAKNAQIDQDKTQKWALFGGVLLLLVSGGVMYNRFRIIRSQKEIIEVQSKETETQKLIIEEKQKEILSSISYAKRLQDAILPPQSLITKYLPESCILFKPKDIVAGVF
jgi:tetratricopeptide (TPR) repeat protein